jgi:hypothetical protein
VSNRAIAGHRRELETAFRSAKAALSAAERNRAHTQLKMLLTAHEDFTQPSVEAELAALEKLQPMTREYYQKLEHICCAVANPPEAIEESWFSDRREPTAAAAQVGGYGSA